MMTIWKLVTFVPRTLLRIGKTVFSPEKTDAGRSRAVLWLCIISLMGHWVLLTRAPLPEVQVKNLNTISSQLIRSQSLLTARINALTAAEDKDIGYLWKGIDNLEDRCATLECENSRLRDRLTEAEGDAIVQECLINRIEAKVDKKVAPLHLFCSCEHTGPVTAPASLSCGPMQGPLMLSPQQAFPMFPSYPLCKTDCWMTALP